MSSHRPYRAALGMPMALDEIRTGRATLYDAEAVDACLELVRNGAFHFEDDEPGAAKPAVANGEDLA